MEGTELATVDFSPLIDALQASITPAQIITVLAAIIAIGMLFVLMWFGVRKLVKIFRNAVFKGQISV